MNEDSKYPELDLEVLHVARLDPEVAKVSRVVRQALLEVHIYRTAHKGEDITGMSFEALVAVGGLTPRTVAPLGNYQTRFHGIPSRSSQDIAVFDVVMTNRTPPLRFIGFADGHTQLVGVNPQI